jgi:hypothetical protein
LYETKRVAEIPSALFNALRYCPSSLSCTSVAYAESFGQSGGILIVAITTAIWVGIFVQTLQKVGM